MTTATTQPATISLYARIKSGEFDVSVPRNRGERTTDWADRAVSASLEAQHRFRDAALAEVGLEMHPKAIDIYYSVANRLEELDYIELFDELRQIAPLFK